MRKQFQGITICGSLRAQSSNKELLAAYEQLASGTFDMRRLETLDTLPHYNPDEDREAVAEGVSETRRLVAAADFLVVSTPEYIHALPAALKNLFEWLVSDPNFCGKPVVILHGNESSQFALVSLKEVLATMAARIVEEACVVMTLGTNRISARDILSNPDWRRRLEASLASLSEAIQH